MNNEYIRYVSGNISNQKMIPADTDILKLTIKHPKIEHYTSVYKYSEEQYNTYQKTNSAAGMSGMKTNLLIFDFDDKTDIENAKKDTISMYETLSSLDLKENDIQIYFSGNKGFHLVVSLDKQYSQSEIKSVVKSLSDGLETLDTQVYDTARVFRCPLSLNKKSGLYKIPLLFEELTSMPINDIKSLAEDPQTDESLKLINTYNLTVNLDISNLISTSIDTEIHNKERYEDLPTELYETDKPNFENKPDHLTEAKYALQEGFFEPGERNEAYLILAATYRYLKYPKEIAYNMIKATDRIHVTRCEKKNISREPKPKAEIWNQIINPTYSPTWNGGTFSEKENPLLLKTKARYGIKDVLIDINPVILSDLGGDNFTKYANSYYESRILTGLTDLDNAMPICAGSNVGIVGASGSGKTSITLEILKNMKNSGAISVFASLDMSKSRIYEKLLHKVTNGQMSKDELYKEYINGNGKKYDAMVKEMFPNVFIYSKSAPSVKEMSDYIKAVEDQKGMPVRLLMVDYFERLSSEKSDDTAASKDVSSGIQDLISDFPMLTPITLFQPNKFSLSGGPDKPILSYTAIKGSSHTYQALRQIFSIWRPFSSPEMSKEGYDKFLEIAILKNDLGELDMFKYGWHGKTGTISMLPEEAELEYKEYMKRKNELEAIKNGQYDDI